MNPIVFTNNENNRESKLPEDQIRTLLLGKEKRR